MHHSVIGDLNSFYIAPEEGNPDSVIIFIHGYGANGRDLIGLSHDWKGQFPNTVFVSPDAPFECEASPFGRQWFSLADYTHEAMEREIQIAWKHLNRYIDNVIAHFGIVEQKIVLCGFSQGTMMALHTIMKRETKCAGLLGYSGRLLDHDLVKETKNKDVPIHLIHGSADPVVPVEEWDTAMTLLGDNGFTATGYKSKGLAHNIDLNGIESGASFIKECLSKS
jgi:phospholipase/carboxylesterase